MNEQVELKAEDRADDPKKTESGGLHEVGDDLAYKRLTMVNVVFVGAQGGEGWVLIDTGIPHSDGSIVAAAALRYGEGTRPRAIVMTHGHFDHAGSLEALARHYDVPVYAHPAEHPYLNGTALYPKPDAKAGGGLVTLLSPLFPSHPVNVSRWLRPLAEDGSIEEMPGWRWVYTPGHSPGHISLWRESDRTLIAGDAVITTAVESAYSNLTQSLELHGPPAFLTPDWGAAAASARELDRLKPDVIISGHGRALRGEKITEALHVLARDFQDLAVPKTGDFIHHPIRVGDPANYRKP